MDANLHLRFSNPLKVLVVEDNQVDLRVLEAMLTENDGYTSLIKTTSTLKGALELLEETKFEVVILDLNLPDYQGTNTIKRINELYPYMAIVINTGAYEEELGIQALDYGAQDFLVKGKYNGYTLIKVLHYAVKRKDLETELLDTYEQLKDAQNQLIQIEKLKVVGDLASGVAHEVRNPLAAIQYGVQYLNEQLNGKSEKIDIVLNNITESSHRANNIIKELLDFSGLCEMDKQDRSLNEAVIKSLALVNHEIERRTIHVNINLDEQLPEVLIDQNRVEQVIINLILNAIHAFEESGELHIRTYQSGRHIYLEIKDTGSGIDDKHIHKIFDPFFTTRRANGGVGLGLSVCKNIMDIHKGRIIIQNDPRGGAIAKLVFPTNSSEDG